MSAVALVRDSFSAWNADKAPRLAAALAFSAIFSIAPLFIITIALTGQVLGFAGSAHPHASVENRLVEQVGHAVGPQAAEAVRGMVDASFGKPRQTVIAQIIGWVTFVVGAIGLFASLQDALNTIWDVSPKQVSLWVMLRERLASLAMLLVIFVVFTASFAANAGIAFVATFFGRYLPFPGAAFVFAVVNWIISIAVLTLLFAMIYRFLPDATVRWRDVGIGAAITAVLIVVGQSAIALYLSRTGVGSAYGAAGSLLALLTWIYYSSLVLLFGAEFTKIYARARGDAIGVRASGAAA